MNDGRNLAGSQTVGLLFFVGGAIRNRLPNQCWSKGRMFGARGEGWVPLSRACRRDPLLAEDAGFLFFRISEFSDIFLGRELRQTPGKPPATWHQLGTKTRCWSGYFLEWRGARSNGITMG